MAAVQAPPARGRSKNEIAAQKEEVEQQKQIAEGRLGMVRETVDTLVGEVPEGLKNDPFADAAHERVLQSITTTTRQMSDRQGAADTGILRRGLVGVLRREGDLLLLRRDLDGAGQKYEEALKVAEAAYRDEEVQKDKAKGNLAVVLTAMAELARARGQADKAIEHLSRAVALRKEIVDQPQSGELPVADAKVSLGGSYYDLARALREVKKDYAAALDAARRSEEALREAAAAGGVSPKIREQARMHEGLAALEVGRSALKLGRTDEGKKGFEEAVRRFQELAKEPPGNTTHLKNLEVAAAEYGDELLIRLHQPAEARRYYEIAVAQSRALAMSPEIRRYQQEALARDHYRLGAAALKTGDKEAASRHFAACRGVREALLRDLEASPEGIKNPGLLTNPRINLMLAQARSGKVAEAVEMAGRLGKAGSKLPAGHPQKHRLLMHSAFGFALAADSTEPAKRKEYLGVATQALRQAVASGYGDLATLETEPDLDPLRNASESRSEFQTLLQQVRAAKK